MLKKTIFLFLFFTTNNSFSANYCVITKTEANCSYVDVKSCHDAATQTNGMCVPQNMGKTDGLYCMVTVLGKNCAYETESNCLINAKAFNGECVKNL